MESEIKEQILGRVMTRTQFIRYIGIAGLSVFGLGNVIGLLRDQNQHTALPHKGVKGFGSRKFGE